ncbi:MAG: methyltransferase [Rhizobium sp.]|nr:methyltransferase [Rhizobium sp.]
MPKYTASSVWFARPAEIRHAGFSACRKDRDGRGRFETRSGLFSHAHADEGSELLASRLPTDFNGNAADFRRRLGLSFGHAGWPLRPRPTGIDLFEASHEALEHAKRNLARTARP